MTSTFKSSQVFNLLPQSNQPQYLKFLQRIKPFLLLWKSQQIPNKMLAKGKKLRLPRVRAIFKKREKARLQILPLLSPNELLTLKLPRQQLRILALVLRSFYLFTVFIYIYIYIYIFFLRLVFCSHYQWRYIPFVSHVMTNNGELLCCRFVFFFICVIRMIN